MNRIVVITALVLFSLVQFVTASDSDRFAKTDWDAFSKNLMMALGTDNDGLKQSAMQHIITYRDYLDVDDAVFDMIRIYRYHENEKMRQLAVVAIHCTGNGWAIDFLKRNLKFEDNPTIKRQILECVKKSEESASFARDVTNDSKTLVQNER